MPTNAKTKAKRMQERKNRQAPLKREPQTRRRGAVSAIELLKQDHQEVQQLFEQFEEAEGEANKEELARKICMELTVHAQIEEEIFYPQARKATQDDDLLDEALVEHDSAKKLIAEIEEMDAGDDLFDAKVKVLGEQIKHHIEEEESELFPELDGAKIDLEAIGEQLTRRKQELLEEKQEA